MIIEPLLTEIQQYCNLNKIEDVNAFTNKILKQGLTVEKFGATPNSKIVEKEVIKEVPVEVIKEVPVEVIKEIIVNKEVYVTDDSKLQEVLKKTTELELLLSGKDVIIQGKDTIIRDKNLIIQDKENKIQEKEKEIQRLTEELKGKKNIYGE